jgi:phosphoglycerate dehydrogenase-like enzyme
MELTCIPLQRLFRLEDRLQLLKKCLYSLLSLDDDCFFMVISMKIIFIIFIETARKDMDERIHVLSMLQLREQHLDYLRAVSPRLEITQHSIASDEDFSKVLSEETEILYTHTAPFDLGVAPRLRWVQVDSAGVDLLHSTPLWKSTIPITSANGVHAIQIGEHVLALLLAHAHRLPLAYRWQERAHWGQFDELRPFITPELRGMTLGILGYGAIGREIARLASAFGMHILATKRANGSAVFDGWTPGGTGDPEGRIPEHFYDLDELHQMLPECDALVLALPKSARTLHLIGEVELQLMRPHCVLINIGRGALIDQHALVRALSEEGLGGVALDVTDPEPLPADSPLWALPNVLITPHVAGLSIHYDDRIVELFAENLRRYLQNEPLLNLVQREQGY